MIGRTVSHYRIVSHIGAGGMGTVYLAEDTMLNRRVALKFLVADNARSIEASARLLREARAASALEHPNIGTIYEVGEFDGQPFIAMAYYEGETLAGRLARGILPMREAAHIVSQIADALVAAHAAGVVHRDLKPSNLMLTSSGHVKVLDFGIATFASADTETVARLTGAGTTVGTAAYMSPEQASGREVDTRSDLWSLGVVTREMLTGRVPFDGSNTLAVIHAVLSTTPPPLRSLRADVAPELEEIVHRTMVADRERRTITAADVRDLAEACGARLASGTVAVPAAAAPRRGARVALAVCALVAVAASISWWVQRNANVRWAREVAVPEVIRLFGESNFDAAYQLGRQAEAYIPADPILAVQLRLVTRNAVVESEPAGAEVFYRPYGRVEQPWRRLGTTPIENARVPRGLLHWRVSLAGFDTAEDVAPDPFSSPELKFELVRTGTAQPGMVRIVSSNLPFQLSVPGLEHLPPVNLPDFWMDQHEVTNREFKRFVDDGGYRRQEFWQESFVKDGQVIAFDAAIAAFADTTGRPGPATWEQGTFPAGQDDYPVTGVSWFEAAAYARWAGKSLPTLYHWSRVADQRLSGDVVPVGSFGGKSLLPVTQAGGLTRGGASGMAGNAKEWCLNPTGAKRFTLGGAWNEPVYMFTDADAQSPFARDTTYGFRLIKTDRPEDLSTALTDEVELPSRDLRAEPEVSNEVFRAWQSLYSFDHGNLDATVDSLDDSSPEWRVEHVSFAAAYGGERVPALLFLPRRTPPPYQTLVYFPGSGTINRRAPPPATDIALVNFVMRSGRALIYPIYKSTNQRSDVITSDYPSKTALWRDHMVMWSKDVGRTLDYLHSRPDIDTSKIGYMGSSWGAGLAPLFLALEPRLSLALLNVGGFYFQEALPEADPVNFASRVKVPILMLNGRFDFFFPTETSQEPMFERFGTPAEHKRRIVYDASHTIPRNEIIKEFVAWMDKYWGPVTQ